MPGIVGLISRMPPERASRELHGMLKTLRHDESYSTGVWAEASLGVYVGWCARKGPGADGMPLVNGAGDVSLVFSGEEFSGPDMIHGPNEGAAPRAGGASYLVRLYEEHADFPLQLNGLFHGLLTDRPRGLATLFNDRFGMHRLYYHEAKDAFYFAAEAKAILAVRPELRALDARGLGEFVACGCVLEDRTIFRGIRLLPPASAWVFCDGSIREKGTYFHPRAWEEQSPLDPETYYHELREAFARSVPRYFNGSDRIGIALTGGLDTRMIMAWQKARPGTLPCYTFGGTFRESRDVLVARQVAKACEQSHQVIPVGAEFLSRFADYAERSVYLTDGCVDVSRAHDLYVSEKAREIAPVKVVGTYASEMLNQASMVSPVKPVPGLFNSEVLAHVGQAEATYTGLRRGHPVTFAAFRQFPWWHYGVLALEQSQLTVRSPYLDNEFVRTVFRAPKPTPADGDVRLRLINEGSPALGRIRSDLGIGGSPGGLLGAASRGLLEFTFKAEYAYDSGMPQWLARMDHACSSLHFERLFLGRHKLLHYRLWYRDVLSKYVREMLLDSRSLSRPYLERAGLEAVVQGHLRGDRNYTTAIHKVLTLELLHRLFLDEAVGGGR